MAYEVETKELLPQLALTVRKQVSTDTIARGMGEAFATIMNHAETGAAHYAGPPFCLYPEMPEGQFEIIVAMPVAPGATAGAGIGLEEVPGGRAASTMHRGPYSGIGEAYEALGAWMALNGHGPAGPPREVYLNDPGLVSESDLLTEVDWPIT